MCLYDRETSPEPPSMSVTGYDCRPLSVLSSRRSRSMRATARGNLHSSLPARVLTSITPAARSFRLRASLWLHQVSIPISFPRLPFCFSFFLLSRDDLLGVSQTILSYRRLRDRTSTQLSRCSFTPIQSSRSPRCSEGARAVLRQIQISIAPSELARRGAARPGRRLQFRDLSCKSSVFCHIHVIPVSRATAAPVRVRFLNRQPPLLALHLDDRVLLLLPRLLPLLHPCFRVQRRRSLDVLDRGRREAG